jgi:spore maturation protein CgeB
VEGSARFFTPGEDFLEFDSVAEAVTAITSLVRDPELRQRIAGSGHRTSSALIRRHVFWVVLDERLGTSAMAPR